MKYQRSSTQCSKDISKVNVFKRLVKLQGQGHRDKNVGTYEKVLQLGILMWNINALAFTVQKLLARLTFQTDLQNDRMSDRTKTIWPRSLIWGIKIKCFIRESSRSFTLLQIILRKLMNYKKLIMNCHENLVNGYLLLKLHCIFTTLKHVEL